MESRALLAFALSLAILIGYQMMFAPEPPVSPAGEAVSGSVTAPAPEDIASIAGVPQDLPGAAPRADEAAVAVDRTGEKLLTIETDLYRAVFSSHGGRLSSFILKAYEADSPEAEASRHGREMVTANRLRPLGLYWMDDAGTVASDTALVYSLDLAEIGGGAKRLSMTAETDGGRVIKKELTLRDGSYALDLVADVGSDSPRSIGLAWTRAISTENGRMTAIEGPTGFIDLDLESEAGSGLEEPVQFTGSTSWAGYADHYFLAAFYPPEPSPLRLVATARNGEAQATVWSDAGTARVEYGLFIGPKSFDILKSVGHHLEEAVDLGIFTVIARPLFWLLQKLHLVTGNWGWAIILLTIAIRIAFYPVNQKQARAMKAMQRIQPEMKKIQEKYKDDREKLNQEMMETYRRHKVNPLAGCLPMLLQLPVFIGLYNVLLAAIELRRAPFVGWITDLSQPDRLGALALPFVSPAGIPVMTLLMGASMFIQQKMTPAAGDPTQQRMMMFLPLIFTVMFINFPSGLVLYWLSNNVMSIGQQYMTNRSSTA